MAEKIFEALTNDIALLISGPFNRNITDLEKAFGVSIVCRGTDFKITGDDENVRRTLSALNTMTDLHSQGTTLDEQSIRYCINMAQSGDEEKIKTMSNFAFMGDPEKRVQLMKADLQHIENQE